MKTNEAKESWFILNNFRKLRRNKLSGTTEHGATQRNQDRIGLAVFVSDKDA